MREDIVIVAAGRTALGNFGGTLSAIPASELGATVIKGLLERSGLQATQINEVIWSSINGWKSAQTQHVKPHYLLVYRIKLRL